MSLTKEQYDRAITRNLYELADARLERSVLVEIEAFNSEGNLYVFGNNRFFKIAWKGLFNSMMEILSNVVDGAAFLGSMNSRSDWL